MVWSTTASSSPCSASRSTWSRSLAAKPVHGVGGVVAAAVEAPVDQVLDPAPQRREQRGHGQGGGGHGQAARPLGELGGGRDDQQVGHDQQGGDHRVGDGPADQPVQVPQPVAEHRHRHRQRQARQRQDERGQPGPRRDPVAVLEHQQDDHAEQPGHRGGGPGGDPAQLLALDPPRGPEPQDQADQRRGQAADMQERADLGQRARHRPGRPGQPERVCDRRGGELAGGEDGGHGQGGPGDAGGHRPPPAGRAQPPVGQQQQRQGHAEGDGGRPQRLADGRVDLGGQGKRAAAGHQVTRPGLAGHVQRPDQARGRQQPADRVVRPAQAEDQPEHGEAKVQPGGQRALGQHAPGQWPDQGQGDRQAGGQAAEGGREQCPGEHGPGPGGHGHGLILAIGSGSIGQAGLAGGCLAGGTGPLRSRPGASWSHTMRP